MSTVEQYGRFDEKRRCFEIRQEPPRKWRNILYNRWGGDEYYAEAIHIGDGMSRFRDARGNTVNVIGYDAKFLYIRDEESGTVFNPAGLPVATPVSGRRIRIYPSKTEISSVCRGLRVTARYIVPKTECIEAWTAFVENRTDRPRRVSVFAYAMFQLNGSDPEGRGFGKDNHSEVHPDLGGVVVLNRAPGAPLKKINGFLVALGGFAGANGYRDHFTRADYGLGAPNICFGWYCDNRGDFGPDCAGIVQCTLELPPRGTGRADFVAGPCEGLDEVRAIRARLSPEALDRMDAEQTAEEDHRAAAFSVDLGRENADRSAQIGRASCRERV